MNQWGVGLITGLMTGLAIGWYDSEGFSFRTILVIVLSFAVLAETVITALGREEGKC